jgi:hypothetical protein
MKPLDSRSLFHAIKEVLDNGFEEEVETLILGCPVPTLPWSIDETSPLFERFDEWLELNLRRSGDLSCLSPLGRPVCKRVLQIIGGVVSTTTPQMEIIRAIHLQLGLPALVVVGRLHYLSDCTRLLAEANAGRANEDRLATNARQMAERIMRETALLFAHTDAGELLVDALTKDDNIVLPARFDSQHPDRSGITLSWLRQRLGDENWGDLGFFALLLRRGSKAILRRRELSPPLTVDVEILKQEESDAFLGLAQALQSYVHFKPSQALDRFSALRSAIEQAAQALNEMANRDVLPNAFIAMEKVTGLFGQSYLGRNDTGRPIRIRCDENLPLGTRVLYRLSHNSIPELVGWVQTPWG